MKRIPLFGLGLVGLGPCVGLVLALVSALASAEPSVVTEARTVPEFHAIDLAGVLDVNVSVGSPAKVEVTGEPALVAKVTTSVEHGVLVLDTRKLRKFQTNRRDSLRVTITAPSLSSLVLSGVGSLKAAGLTGDNLAIDLSGTGEISAAGSTSALHVKISGVGDVRAKDLPARSATVELGGPGHATVRATESIDARLTGIGDIDVYGHPAQIRKSVSGLGGIHVR